MNASDRWDYKNVFIKSENQKENKNLVIWIFVEMTDIPNHGGKGSNKRNKKYQEFSPFPEAHKPDVLTLFFPLLLSALRKKETGQHSPQEIFHDIKEDHESRSAAGEISETKLGDLM